MHISCPSYVNTPCASVDVQPSPGVPAVCNTSQEVMHSSKLVFCRVKQNHTRGIFRGVTRTGTSVSSVGLPYTYSDLL